MKVFESTSFLKHWAIGLLPVVFFVIGMHACSDYGIGRAAMHALPFFIAPVVFILNKLEPVLSPGAEKSA